MRNSIFQHSKCFLRFQISSCAFIVISKSICKCLRWIITLCTHINNTRINIKDSNVIKIKLCSKRLFCTSIVFKKKIYLALLIDIFNIYID